MGSIGIMEKKMETTLKRDCRVLGSAGFRGFYRDNGSL